jgi:DnaK suppressor protein
MGKRKLLAERITEERQVVRMRLSKMALQAMNGSSHGRSLSGGHARDVMEQAQQGLLKEQEVRACEFLTSRIKALDRAWEELQRGTYGVCRLCGKRIPQKRLEAVPTATLCVSCQEAVE